MMANEGRRGLGAPIYVLANQGNSFAETLANTVGFRFDEHVSFRFVADFLMQINSMPQRDDNNRLTRVLNAIEKSAFSYMQMYGRPAVIVIDGVDWLQKYMPAALDHLLVSSTVLQSITPWVVQRACCGEFTGFCSRLKTELHNRACGGDTAPS